MACGRIRCILVLVEFPSIVARNLRPDCVWTSASRCASLVIAALLWGCGSRVSLPSDATQPDVGADQGFDHAPDSRADAFDVQLTDRAPDSRADAFDVQLTDHAPDSRPDAFDAVAMLDGIDATPRDSMADAPSIDIVDETCPRTCASMGASCGTLRDGCVGTARCGGTCVGAVRSVSVDVRQLVYDSVHDVLYAGVGPLDGVHPDTFAVLDPDTGSVRESFAEGVPIDAVVMISGWAYFAFDVPWRIGPFSFDEQTIGWRYGGPRTASMSRAHAVAGVPAGFLLAATPADGSVGCTALVQVEWWTRRQLPTTASLDACPPSFATDSSGFAYGIAPTSHGSVLQILQTSPGGVSATTVPFATSVVRDTHATIALRRLYTTAGAVYDLSVPASPALVGAIPLAGGVAVDASTRVALVFGNVNVAGSNALAWRAFDADTLAPIFDDGSSLPIGPDGYVSQMVQTGPNRFAAIVYPDGAGGAGALYILHVPLQATAVGDAGADAAPTDGAIDVAPCWIADGGPYDPTDPTAEAQRRVWELARQGAAYYAERAAADAGGSFPFTAPRTPASVPAACTIDPAGTWATPSWLQLRFAFGPGESHRYSYQFDSVGSGSSAYFTARAIGDLDGDGIFSTFEVAGVSVADGGVELNDLWVAFALE